MGGSPALTIAYRGLRDLVPYVRNARTHTPEQVAKLRASLARYGWTNPMLIAGNELVAGHARLQAAIAMAESGEPVARNPDPWQGPTIDLSHLSPADRRAYVIADNRLAEDAGWDDEMLRIEMGELQLEGFDLSLTGFELAEIGEILSPVGEAEAEEARELSSAENDALDMAWKRLVRDWHEIIASIPERTWTTSTATRGALQVHYLRALFLGTEIPRTATLAYTPHRILTSANHGSIFDQLEKALGTEDLDRARGARDAIRWLLAEKPAFDMFCCGTSLPVQGARAPNDFPALLARDLIDEFTVREAARVLDPCHGWGGRLLGFMLSERATAYHGFDPSPLAHKGVGEMFADLAPLTPSRRKNAVLDMLPFEQSALKANAYDFALTSPPYFDVEQYEGELSSHRVHPSFDAWVAGFYRPLLSLTARALKPGAIFALQVGSQQYPLARTAIDLAPSAGLTHVETRHTGMVNNKTETDPDEGEVIVLLRKAA